jgi:hypothetical protein
MPFISTAMLARKNRQNGLNRTFSSLLTCSLSMCIQLKLQGILGIVVLSFLTALLRKKCEQRLSEVLSRPKNKPLNFSSIIYSSEN